MNQMMENFTVASQFGRDLEEKRLSTIIIIAPFPTLMLMIGPIVCNFSNIPLSFPFQVVVHRNNIYYAGAVADWPSNVKQLTRNGQEGVIFNGVPDWLYSDKIFGQSDQIRQWAIWFSPEGNKLSYVSFDDSKVSPMSYPKYGSYDDPSNVYPSLVTLRYPLAGRDNPSVSVHVVDLTSSSPDSRKVTPPSDVGR